MNSERPITSNRFAVVLPRVLKHEGRFSDHPRDPGGATMKGVTQRTYDAFRDEHHLPRQPVKRLSHDELAQIYAGGYWGPPHCARLPIGLDYAVFDWSVNSGPRRAVKGLQRALGVTADGVVGSVTLAAAKAAPPERSVNRLCDRRLGFKRRLPTWADFGRGWTRRVEDVRSTALAEIAKSKAQAAEARARRERLEAEQIPFSLRTNPAPLKPTPIPSPQEPTTLTPPPLGRFWRALVDLFT
ncbi:MAG: glycosyl hydrolase 108 family protein [Pseudomonadota bacterium]